eukprot:235820_1
MKSIVIVVLLAMLCHYAIGGTSCNAVGDCDHLSNRYCNLDKEKCKECDGCNGLGCPGSDNPDACAGGGSASGDGALAQDKVADDDFEAKAEAEASSVSGVLIVVTVCSLICGLICCVFGGFMWFRRDNKASVEAVANEEDEDEIEEPHQVPFKETITA